MEMTVEMRATSFSFKITLELIASRFRGKQNKRRKTCFVANKGNCSSRTENTNFGLESSTHTHTHTHVTSEDNY